MSSSNNAKILVEIGSSLPTKLRENMAEALIDGQTIEMTGTYRVLGSSQTKQIKLATTSRSGVAAIRKTAVSSLKKALRKADYAELFGTLGDSGYVIGKGVNQIAGVYDTFYQITEVLKHIAMLSGRAAGPVGWLLAGKDLIDAGFSTWKELKEYMESCGLEEHKLQGQHLAYLDQYLTTLLTASGDAVVSSSKASGARLGNINGRHTFFRIEESCKGSRSEGCARWLPQMRQSVNLAAQRAKEEYVELIYTLIGLMQQTVSLRNVMNGIADDSFQAPFKFWNCSFSGYKNQYPWDTIALSIAEKKVSGFKLVSPYQDNPELNKLLETELARIKKDVFDEAKAKAEMLNTILPSLRDAALESLARMKYNTAKI